MENQEPKFEEIEPGIWKPANEGDLIQGLLISKKENVGLNNSRAYHIDTQDGLFMIWGSTVLDERMEFVNIGDVVRITYKGKTPNKKGQMVHIYKVERARTR